MPGTTPIAEPTEDEQDRIRDPQRRGDREHRRDSDDQRQRDDPVLYLEVHRLIVPQTGRVPALQAQPGSGPRSDDEVAAVGGQQLRTLGQPRARSVHVRTIRCEPDGVQLQLGHG